MAKTRIVIQVPTAIKTYLKEEAEAHGTTVSYLLRRMIETAYPIIKPKKRVKV